MMYHGKQLLLLAQLGHTRRASTVHGERDGEEADRERKREREEERLDRHNRGMLRGPSGQDTNCKKHKRAQRKQEQKTDYK